MPLVPMRVLLDHAAENGYGVAALNVNNMEQIQAIMEAADETDSPGHHPGLARRPQLHQGRLPAPPDARGRRAVPRDPDRHAPGPRQLPGTCFSAIEQGFTSVMMDGSLHEDGKTPRRLRVQRQGHQEGRRCGPRARRDGRGRARHARRHRGRPRRRPHRRGGAEAPDRPGPGRAVRQGHRRGRPGRRHRHQPRRLQVHQAARPATSS